MQADYEISNLMEKSFTNPNLTPTMLYFVIIAHNPNLPCVKFNFLWGIVLITYLKVNQIPVRVCKIKTPIKVE